MLDDHFEKVRDKLLASVVEVNFHLKSVNWKSFKFIKFLYVDMVMCIYLCFYRFGYWFCYVCVIWDKFTIISG